MIISSYTNKDDIPSFGKHIPFIIQSGSMEGTIEAGDIIVTKRIDPKDIKVDDIITFFDPKGNDIDNSTNSFRIYSLNIENKTVDIEVNENVETLKLVALSDDITFSSQE